MHYRDWVQKPHGFVSHFHLKKLRVCFHSGSAFSIPACQAMTNLITSGPSGYYSCTEDMRTLSEVYKLSHLPAVSPLRRAEARPQHRA